MDLNAEPVPAKRWSIEMQTQRCPANRRHVPHIDKDSDLEHGGQRGNEREDEKSCPLRDQRGLYCCRERPGGGGVASQEPGGLPTRLVSAGLADP